MDLKENLRKNKKYIKRDVEILDFIWVGVNSLHIPWWPVCELSANKNDTNLCPILPGLMKDENGNFSTKLKYSMHLELLDMYEKHREGLLSGALWKGTKYCRLHRSYRDNGIDASVRTDEWIKYKIERIIAVYESLKRDGYHYETENFFSVLEKPLGWYYGKRDEIDGYEIYDGSHRAAGLYKIGYSKIKAVLVRPGKAAR